MEFTEVFQTFTDRFSPADPGEAPLQLTMSDLVKVFQSFYPEDIENSTLYDMMIKAGFRYAPLSRSGTIKFFWFMKEAKSPETYT